MKNNRSINKTPLIMTRMLLDNFYSKEEIMEALNIKQVTFFKNLRLISFAGFKYIKENRKYKIVSFKNSINYSILNINIMAHLLTLANGIFPKNKTKELHFIFKKFLYLSSKNDYDNFIEKYTLFNKITQDSECSEKTELFQKYLNKKYTLNITTKQKENLILKPVEYIWGQKNSFFLFEDVETREKKQISPCDILSMHPIKETSSNKNEKETVFELRGRLAKNYVLKENEVLKDVFKDKIVITNYSQDKQKLFKRLLRYDSLCNIVYPLEDRKEFLELLKKSLDNIG